MPRGRKVEPLWLREEDWHAARDRNGQWHVANSRGEAVLRQSDAVRRMQAVYLAASAPALRALLWHVSRRLKDYLQDHGTAYGRDMQLVRTALAEIALSRPPFEVVLKLEREGRQQELALDVGDDGGAGAAPTPRRRRARGGHV
jgi:hypothetical protein